MTSASTHLDSQSRPVSSAADTWHRFRHHSRTFSLATLLLPRGIRHAVAVLYLFCRRIDEIADTLVLEIGEKNAVGVLRQTERQLEQTLAGNPPNEYLWRKLSAVHAGFGLDPEPMRELIAGADWDLEGRAVKTVEDLISYSNLVGGSIGAMMLPLLQSARSPEIERRARSVGIAMQITNILRDVGEDRRRLDRVYLPAELTERYGINISTLMSPTPNYQDLIEDLMRRAEEYYDSGIPGVNDLPTKARTGITAAIRMYREILNEIRSNGYDNLNRRAYVSFGRKASLLLRDSYSSRRSRLGRSSATHET
ncbi:MAG: phytoene/squalene synthase family protein [Rhodothermia bacterium]|nr:phytoene/squalene synthase family protein [Rhodothermia bacterium]